MRKYFVRLREWDRLPSREPRTVRRASPIAKSHRRPPCALCHGRSPPAIALRLSRRPSARTQRHLVQNYLRSATQRSKRVVIHEMARYGRHRRCLRDRAASQVRTTSYLTCTPSQNMARARLDTTRRVICTARHSAAGVMLFTRRRAYTIPHSRNSHPRRTCTRRPPCAHPRSLSHLARPRSLSRDGDPHAECS